MYGYYTSSVRQKEVYYCGMVYPCITNSQFNSVFRKHFILLCDSALRKHNFSNLNSNITKCLELVNINVGRLCIILGYHVD